MFRKLLLASVVALGATGAALAQDDGPRLVGGGGDGGPRVEYGDTAPGSVVGGVAVRMNGGGRDEYFQYGAVNAFPGQVGTLVGGGNEAHVEYQPVPQANGVAGLGIGAPHS